MNAAPMGGRKLHSQRQRRLTFKAAALLQPVIPRRRNFLKKQIMKLVTEVSDSIQVKGECPVDVTPVLEVSPVPLEEQKEIKLEKSDCEYEHYADKEELLIDKYFSPCDIPTLTDSGEENLIELEIKQEITVKEEVISDNEEQYSEEKMEVPLDPSFSIANFRYPSVVYIDHDYTELRPEFFNEKNSKIKIEQLSDDENEPRLVIKEEPLECDEIEESPQQELNLPIEMEYNSNAKMMTLYPEESEDALEHGDSEYVSVLSHSVIKNAFLELKAQQLRANVELKLKKKKEKEGKDCKAADATVSNDAVQRTRECGICAKLCRSTSSLRHHMLVHSDDRPYVCKICDKGFKEQPTLRRHSWTHIDKKHQCDHCLKKFVEKSSLRRHILSIHADLCHGGAPGSQTCPICYKVFPSLARLTLHEVRHGDPDYECDICHKVYAGPSHIAIHRRVHTGEKPFDCSSCGARFAFKHVLKSHMRRIHFKEPNRQCRVCRTSFPNKQLMFKHVCCKVYADRTLSRQKWTLADLETFNQMENIEKEVQEMGILREGEKSIEIEEEAVTKNIKNDSKRAEDTEKVEKSDASAEEKHLFKMLLMENMNFCNLCNKLFKRQRDFKPHVINHIIQYQDLNAFESFLCRICSVTSIRIDECRAHLSTHAQLVLYSCNYCDKTFVDCSNYSKHKKLHLHLVCHICQRKFTNQSSLSRHLKYHDVAPELHCPHCNSIFYYNSSLKKHLKIHLKRGRRKTRAEVGHLAENVKPSETVKVEVYKIDDIGAETEV